MALIKLIHQRRPLSQLLSFVTVSIHLGQTNYAQLA